MFATSSLFDQRHDALIAFGIAPVAILLAVMVAPGAAARRRALALAPGAGVGAPLA